jgi:hypothetical protein
MEDNRDKDFATDRSPGAIDPRFVVIPFDVELPPGATFDNVEELLDRLEGPMHR